MAHERPVPSNAVAKLDTLNTFHTPMFALNADADENACKPNHTRKERLADAVFVGVNLGNFVQQYR